MRVHGQNKNIEKFFNNKIIYVNLNQTDQIKNQQELFFKYQLYD